ncbi:hypothetical protein ABIA96_003648 [Bradyrhizobium sp. LB11.1]
MRIYPQTSLPRATTVAHRKARRLILPSPWSDKSVVLVTFKEIAVICPLGEIARFHRGEGPDRLAETKWDDLYGDAEVARFAELFQPVKPLKPGCVNAIHLASDPMSATRFIEHHWREPRPGNDERKTLDRSVLAKQQGPIETAFVKRPPSF